MKTCITQIEAVVMVYLVVSMLVFFVPQWLPQKYNFSKKLLSLLGNSDINPIAVVERRHLSLRSPVQRRGQRDWHQFALKAPHRR